MVEVSKQDFLADKTGAKFIDVVKDPQIDFQKWLDFFNCPKRQLRMQDAEEHHLRPALSVVILELERDPAFAAYLAGGNSQRGKQCIGVLVRILMGKLGWKPYGRKGSLGYKSKKDGNEKDLSGRKNKSGLSKWFSKAEHYEKV